MKPEIKEIYVPFDAFSVYSFYSSLENTAFLDGNRDFQNLGRYSFIGLNPFIRIKGKGQNYLLNDVAKKGDIFEELREIIKRYKCENKTAIPFIGGAIGYLSYDLGVEMLKIKSNAANDYDLPDYYFIFFDNVIIFDNLLSRKYISSCGILANAHESINKIEEEILNMNIVKNCSKDILSTSKSISNFEQVEYLERISRMREYIKEGDIYIANMTQRFTSQTEKDGFGIYRDLRELSQAPFSAFLKLEGFEIISSSPERFMKIENGKAQTRPIKGTRPRGKTFEEDEKNKLELVQSEKDKSELLMIVDLERNDLSKVCKPHSVKVTELFKLEEYSTVFHLVSTIEGELQECVDAVECMKECFPGGSITGAPKIRAMEIIDELENLKRGVYTGCLGYFGFDANSDFNIIIRTIVKIGRNVYFSAGGGITWESVEQEEYLESLQKAKALSKSI